MSDQAIIAELVQMRQAMEAQGAGLIRMLQIMASNTEMLQKILEAVTAEPEGDSPLVEALRELIASVNSHGVVLERIERRMIAAGIAAGHR